MITFNELYINTQCNRLIVDVSVINESYYKDVYIDSVTIDSQNTFSSSGISSNPIYQYQVEGDLKNLRLTISPYELLGATFDDLLFVYVTTKGTPAADTPCGCDEITSLKVVLDLKPIYDNLMQYIRNMGDTCNIPKDFIDAILRFKAFELSMITGHYTEAINQWGTFKNTFSYKKGGCGSGNKRVITV